MCESQVDVIETGEVRKWKCIGMRKRQRAYRAGDYSTSSAESFRI